MSSAVKKKRPKMNLIHCRFLNAPKLEIPIPLLKLITGLFWQRPMTCLPLRRAPSRCLQIRPLELQRPGVSRPGTGRVLWGGSRTRDRCCQESPCGPSSAVPRLCSPSSPSGGCPTAPSNQKRVSRKDHGQLLEASIAQHVRFMLNHWLGQ